MAPANRKALAWSSYELLRTIVFVLFVLRWTRITFHQFRARGILGSSADLYTLLRRRAFGIFLSLPVVRTKVEQQLRDAGKKIQNKLAALEPGQTRYTRLPAEGWSKEQVTAELKTLSEMKHTRWEDGYVSGAVYHGGQDLVDLQVEAFGKFTVSNPIHPDVFPAVRKMEAEVVSMVLRMFNAPESAAGVTTSGGTESILLCCLSARNKARQERGVTEPEMVLPETAHTAFHKACEYFKIKPRLIACPGPSHKVNIKNVSRAINGNTVLIVGSAPNFPHGMIDDISSLSKLALRYKIPLHVDCCLGSFLVPFLREAGFASEPFDFKLKGVTSITCDTHKYGFAPKGSSTALFRTNQLRAYGYFISPDWSGGVYASPTLAGSRPGALIAGCWASMMSTGTDGYVNACHKIVGAAKTLESAIRKDPRLNQDLTVVGKPLVSVVAFTSTTLSVYEIADTLSAKGWHLNALQNPPAMHVAVTLPIVPVIQRLVDDMAASVAEVREKEEERARAGKSRKGPAGGDAAALYGVAGSLPDKRIVREIAKMFLDTLYKV